MFYLFISLLFLWENLAFSASDPILINGEMTLTAEDLDFVISLNGHWTFHWQRFLPEELDHSPFDPRKIEVPGHWENLGLPSSGWATYHGTINFPSSINEQLLQLHVPLFNGPMKIIGVCDGVPQTILKKGKPSSMAVDSVTSMASKTGFFKACPRMELYVQVSNLVLHPGGITYPIKLARPEPMQAFLSQGTKKQYLLIGFFAFAFIFNFSIAMQRREDKASLFLALFTFLQGVRFFSTEAMLYDFFPEESNWKAQFNQRLMNGTTLVAVVAKLHALSALFPGFINRKFVRASTLILSSLAGISTFLPISGTIWLLGVNITAACGLVVLLTVFYSYVRALKVHGIMVWLSFFGFAVYLITMLFDGVSLITGSDVFIAHFGLMIFIVTQSQVTGIQYAQSYSLTKKLKNDLEAKNIEILEKEKERTLFFHNTSHELRTPLNGILGFTQLLKRGNYGSLPEKAQNQVGKISNLAESLMVQVNTILDIAMNRKGELHLINSVIMLNLVIDEINSLAEGLQVKHQNATYSVRTGWKSEDDLTMVADKEKINIILRNLIGNAFKFSLPDQANHVNVSLDFADRKLTIQVTDTGIGMDKASIPKIFEEFKQLHGDSRRAFEGTGLGLSMVKAIVEVMQGSIEVDSEIGRGSNFKVIIPDQANAMYGSIAPIRLSHGSEVKIFEKVEPVSKVEAPIETCPRNEITLASKHQGAIIKGAFILAVDDNVTNREIIGEVLKDQGYEIHLAKGGREAIATMEKQKPDLILLDLMMPDISGEDVLRWVRAQSRLSDTPVILLTARASDQDRIHGLSMGADDYLAKPIVNDELMLRVSNTLSRVSLTRIAAEKVMIEKTIETLQKVYTSLSHLQESIPSIKARKHYQAAELTGGDWISSEYDGQTRRLYLFIGDVTGHGMASAIVTVVAAGAVNAALASVKKLGSQMAKEDALHIIAEAVNVSLTESGYPLKKSMTMGMICLDLEDGSGYYLNAGHNHVLVKSESKVYALKAGGNPLGLDASYQYKGESFVLGANDTIFLYTDGLTENQGPDQRCLSTNSLRSILDLASDPESIVKDVLKAGGEIWQGNKARDDTAFLAVQWNPNFNGRKSKSAS